MEKVALALTACVVTLCASQAALLLMRSRSCARRVAPLLLSGFLLSVAASLAIPVDGALHAPLVAAVPWAGTAFLLETGGARRRAPWSAPCAVFLVVLALGELIGYRGTLPYTLFFAFGMTLLSAVPLVMLIRTWIGFRSIAVAAATVACALWVLAGAADFVLDLSGRSRLHGAPFAAFLLACSTGWLVFQEGYPSRPGWRGRLASLQPGETLSRSVYARLLASESALAARERLVDSGFLALGAAHELKNTLSNIRATALHGLAQEDAGSKDESLRLLLEHAGIGADSATALLSRISSTGREEPVLIDAARDLSGFMRMARAAFRGEGITLQAELQPGTRFHARRSEVEQILMHLIRNAAEAYRKLGTEGRKAIVVTARTVDEFAVLEVQDAAGGIPADAVPRLFSMASSGSGSTGLGLCLSRGLAQENGGSLEYQQNDRGCSFRLVFPSEQGPEA